MAIGTETVRDLTILHWIGLDRFATGEVRRIRRELQRVRQDITAQIAERWADGNAAPSAGDLRLEALLAQTDASLQETHRVIRGQVEDAVTGLAEAETDFTDALARASVGTDVRLATVSADQLRSAVMSRPFAGRYLRDFVADFGANSRRRVAGAIRMAYIEGESVGQAIRRVQAAHDISRRGAEVLVRTSFTHTNAAAVSHHAKQNPEVFRRYQYFAVLDNRTTTRCRGLAGRVFVHGKGPLPPQHPQCRSSIASIPPGIDDFGEDLTFKRWLGKQDATVQRDVLGPTRYKLYRDGGADVETFQRDGRRLTLAQLKERDAELFKRAGVE